MSDYGWVSAGDVIENDFGTREYVFDLGCDVLGVNACSRSWIERGRRFYGEECYALDEICLSGYRVVGHLGDGSMEDGWAWYDAEHMQEVQHG